MKKILIPIVACCSLMGMGCSAVEGLFAGDTNTSETQNTIADDSSGDLDLASSSSENIDQLSSIVEVSSESSDTSDVPVSSGADVPLSSADKGMNVRVNYTSGAIAARVQVKLISESDWDSHVLADADPVSQTLTADDSGYVSIPNLNGEAWTIVIEDQGEGLFMKLNDSLDGTALTTAPLLRHVGNVGGTELTESSEICLQSTDYCTAVDNNGDYQFESLPPGNFEMVFRDSNKYSLSYIDKYQMQPGSDKIDSIYYQENKIVLEDFQDKDHYGVLSTWSGNGHWWMVHEGASSFPYDNQHMSEGMIEDPIGSGNWVFQTQINLDQNENFNYSLLGLNIGEGADNQTQNVWADLSAMDSVTFRIEGSGAIEFFFQSKLTLVDHSHLYAKINLTGGWQNITLLPSDFIKYSGSVADINNVTFEQAARRAGAAVIRFENSGTYRLDDLSIHGVEVIKFYDWWNTGL